MTAATDPTTAAAPAPGPDSEHPTVEINTDRTAEPVEDDVLEDEPVEDDLVLEPVEDGDVDDEPGLRDKIAARRAAAAAAAASWRGLVTRPMSVREAMEHSIDVDATRIPGDSQFVAFLWWLDNRVGRRLLLVLGALLFALGGTVLWCVARPSRRAGLYVMLVVIPVIVFRVLGG